MRFAAQRLLAELPQGRFDDAAIEAVANAAMELDAARTVGRLIGQPVEGQQLLMQLRPAGVTLPFDGQDASEVGARQINQQVNQLIAEPPMAVRELVFGWVPEGGLSPDQPHKMSYQKVAGAAPAKAELQAAMAELIERGGLSSGDVLVNMPYGASSGDYKRALSYMAQGFGAPNVMGEQMARVGRSGELVPEQLMSTLPGFAQRLGWAQALSG